jgi:CheY-like chemotaxis protein
VNSDVLAEKIKQFLPSDQASPTVLVVDDDSFVRDIMCKTVRKSGWNVVEAANGREAIEKLNLLIPSVILLDLLMPEMDGFAVIHELQKQEKWRQIPVIVITAKDLNAEERATLTKYTALFLQKGTYTPQKLTKAIYEQIKMLTEKRR